MTPLLKIQHLILLKVADQQDDDYEAVKRMTAYAIERNYAELVYCDMHWDAMNEIRENGIDTGLPCESSRNYESKSVAKPYIDGSWIGWTYWYGGGKHSDPESIDWIEHAYDVTVAEEQQCVTVRTFTVTPETPAPETSSDDFPEPPLPDVQLQNGGACS